MLIQALVCAVVLYGLYRFLSRFPTKDEPAKEPPPMSDYERGRMNLYDAFYTSSGNLRAGAVGMPAASHDRAGEDRAGEDMLANVEAPVVKSQWHECDPLAAEPECPEPYLCLSGNINNEHHACMTGATAKFHCEHRQSRNRWDAKARRCVPA